ncbi:hydrogenase maturation protease [Kitasatospora sp. GAS204B]|uniref:hydrogenase maturation protease n=1 Tax=unclassified Kitasatospora TaxID=2633591 RepID=UPI002475C951|nr:hydrogenase maturation protease [Kitasatospora sp. GAS204B]MDH6121367.1 hydrogenase maturation protease [Kitasatospora sp. GAS204B]
MNLASRIVVIGVGNEYRRDDGVGRTVVARLAERAVARPLPDGTTLRVCDGDPARLLTLWEAADLAVVVDAAHAHPGHPGRVHRLELGSERLSPSDGPTSSHGLGLGEAVELARALDRLPGTLVVYAVEGANTTMGTGLSAPVAAAVDPLVARIADDLRAATADTSTRAAAGPAATA